MKSVMEMEREILRLQLGLFKTEEMWREEKRRADRLEEKLKQYEKINDRVVVEN